jgi:hypothetical protein
MKCFVLRIGVFGILLASLAALPAAAVDIKAGIDYWRTPDDGKTFFVFPEGDVESLCGKEAQTWDNKVAMAGVPTAGSDWDTAVARLDDVTFSGEVGTTRLRVKELHLATKDVVETPCGKLRFVLNLACCPQPTTRMRITRSSSGGGTFNADISLSVEIKAYDDNGAYKGSLFYNRELPDKTGDSTAWSFGSKGEFRAGMDDKNDCREAARKKGFDPDSPAHAYYIAQLSASGNCNRTGAAAVK